LTGPALAVATVPSPADGDIDFTLIKCVAPDTFQRFVTGLTAAPHVRNVKTSVTLRNSKDAALVPMEEIAPASVTSKTINYPLKRHAWTSASSFFCCLNSF
jgi:hypothetical protein